jgi:OpgC protein
MFSGLRKKLPVLMTLWPLRASSSATRFCTYSPDGALWSGLIDKWHLGALRLLDFSSFAILFAVSRSWLSRWLTISPLISLGKASLEVFCAHLLSCFAVGDGAGLPAWIHSALIATTLIGLYMVARLFAHPALASGPPDLQRPINPCSRKG